MRNLVMALSAISFLAACGGSSGGGGSAVTLHCTFGDSCDAITGSMSSDQRTAIEAACTRGSGVVGNGACSTAGMVAGHCTYGAAAMASFTGVSVDGATMVEYYLAASWTAAEAQSFCVSPPGGTWTP